MAVELPGGIKVLNPSPTDAWSGPYSSVGEANLSINPLVRYKTMIVRIVSDLYWYRNGTANADLVLFNGENCGTYLTTVPLTLTTPTKGGVVSTNIGSGLAYTAGSLISVVGTPDAYYLDVTSSTSSTSIAFNQAATVDVFMIGGGGGGGGGRGGGGGAGAYKNVGSISVASGTTLNITVGAGGTAGSTTVNSGSGGDTFIQLGGNDYQLLRVKGGGGGGIGTSSGYSGGDGGDGGNGGGGGAGTVSGGEWGAATGGGVNGSGSGNNGGAGGTGGGGGGGGGGSGGVGGTGTSGGGGGDSKILKVLDYDLTFGGGGGGGGGNNGRNAGSSGSGPGYGGGGGSAGGGGQYGTGTGSYGGSGRVILKVKTPANINPFIITSGAASVSSYLDTTNITTLYKFEGIVSSYDRTTGAITISNIQNITGSFAGSTAYTFNVNTFNGGNAGTNIEIITSKVNLSINSDIQMNGKKIVSPNALYLEVPFSTQAVGSAVGFMIVNVNGSSYKIALYSR